jgi:hypothetical protein
MKGGDETAASLDALVGRTHHLDGLFYDGLSVGGGGL